MIYCDLKGGLGNMMFQIAACLSFAKDNNTESIFPNLKMHLHYLNEEKEYNPNINYTQEYNALNIFKNLKCLKRNDSLKVYEFPFNYKNVKLESSDAIINGFFQTEKYFIHNETYIRKIFQIDEFVLHKINEKYKEILKYKETTSIHIRRGDYLKLKKHHPSLSLDYFRNAIDLTKQNTDKYIIFSDDIEWCKTKFQGNKFIFIENERDYIELYLMSLCKNNIISNSSFSWWGAWLNPNERKIIISPKKWFGEMIKEDDSDIIPENWKRI